MGGGAAPGGAAWRGGEAVEPRAGSRWRGVFGARWEASPGGLGGAARDGSFLGASGPFTRGGSPLGGSLEAGKGGFSPGFRGFTPGTAGFSFGLGGEVGGFMAGFGSLSPILD